MAAPTAPPASLSAAPPAAPPASLSCGAMGTVDVVTQTEMPLVEDDSLNIPQNIVITEDWIDTKDDVDTTDDVSPLMNVMPDDPEDDPEDDEEEEEEVNENNACACINWKIVVGLALAVGLLAYLVWMHIQLRNLEHRISALEHAPPVSHAVNDVRFDDLDHRLTEVEQKPVFLQSHARRLSGELQKNVLQPMTEFMKEVTSRRGLARKFNAALRSADALLNNLDFCMDF